ncbi:elongation of very long chain fatty acids protein 1-like [Panonychus citri]|uniref:elongation of very long chain fatty acids protein 1-like n=1 Tax=Panonychus citri TaxID=50023 RepID=UPI002307FAC5|nr:elongation of very long chain fatty acids protein 1-like [Panonychus citri]
MSHNQMGDLDVKLFFNVKDSQETAKKLIVLFIVYYYFVKVFGPKWMTLRQPFNLYPHLLVYNGYQFGVHGVGLLLALWTTNFGTICWSCEPIDTSTKEIKRLFSVYVVYIFFWAKIMECLETVMYILMKKRRYIQLIEIFRTFANVGLVYLGLKNYPGTLTVFYPLCDLIAGVFIFGHNTLLSANVDLKPRQWWGKFIFTLRLIEFTALFFHGLYFLIMYSSSSSTLFHSSLINHHHQHQHQQQSSLNLSSLSSLTSSSNCTVPRVLPLYECLFALLNIVIIICYYLNVIQHRLTNGSLTNTHHNQQQQQQRQSINTQSTS